MYSGRCAYAISGEIFAVEKLLICGCDRIQLKELLWRKHSWRYKQQQQQCATSMQLRAAIQEFQGKRV